MGHEGRHGIGGSLVDRRLEAGPVDGFVECAVHVMIDQRDAAQMVGQRVGHVAVDSAEHVGRIHQPAYRATSSAFTFPAAASRDGRAEDFDRPARLRFGEHQRWRDLQDVAADVVDNRSQLPRTVDHLRGEPGIALPGLRVDEFQPDRQPAPADIADPFGAR